MGTVFKKTVNKPLPRGAETFERKREKLARWKDRRGKARTAPLTVGEQGQPRIVIESSRYYAKYRDAAGVVQVVPTGCRDETAARRVLADLERKAELVRSGVMSAAEAAVGHHQATPLTEHIDAYLAHLEAAGVTREHRANVSRQLRRLVADCSFARLADLNREALEQWLTTQARDGMGARTRNTYLAAALSFANWCADPNVRRLASNPFLGIAKANEKADPRRQRRAMVEAELVRLLDVARQRPLLDAMTVRRGKRRGERYANLRPETKARLELLGRERALIYKTLVLTGLRKKELTSLTVAQLHFDEEAPYAALDAADEKNREGNLIPLRDDLAKELKDWLADKLARLQQEALRLGEPIPIRLPPDMPVFDVPDKLSKILNRDLRLAGIPKRDDRGRVLDVHALRHTFGTLMSKGGIAPRTAQAAMRHSKLDLTMSVYTDPRLLDVRGALGVLPALPPDGTGREAARATGTQGEPRKFAPGFAPTLDKWVQTEAPADKRAKGDGLIHQANHLAVSASGDKRNDPLTTDVNGCQGVGATGLEPVTPSVSSWCSSQLS
jgi:integrase